jgi:peroxiredoxin Q/BCP
MQAYQQNLHRLEASNTQVLGVSMDSSFSNKAWAGQIGISFPLLSDWGGEVTRRYGVYDPTYKAARRTTFVISPAGRIEEIRVDREALDPSSTVNFCERRRPKP